jgi:twinkle protein
MREIKESTIQELRLADVKQVVEHFVTLKKDGANLVACCPFPGHDEKTPSFKVSTSKNIYKCFGCGKSGDGISFLQDYKGLNFVESCEQLADLMNIDLEYTEDNKNNNNNYPANNPATKKPIVKKAIVSNEKPKDIQTYSKPNKIQQTLNKEVLELFLRRGISENTLQSFKVSQSVHYFAQLKKEGISIDFNYYKNNELVNIKHRSLESKSFGLEKGCELILWNLDNVDDSHNQIIITEGEFDTLALGEVFGNKNIVSVPNGANSSKKQNLTYLDGKENAKLFEGKQLILFFDNDDPGKMLTDAFVSRFGAHRCLIPTYPANCKDANDILLKHGKQGIINAMDSIKFKKVEGIVDVSDFRHKVRDYHKNGFPKGDRIGLDNVDKLISFRGGELTMVTGISGSGKSEFLDFIMVQLAKIHNWNFGICSMENPPEIHFTKLAEKYLNKPFEDVINRSTGELYFEKMNDNDLDKAEGFIFNHFNFITHKTTIADGEKLRSTFSVDYILNQAKTLVQMYGIKGLVIDPWNTIEHVIQTTETETNYVSRILSKVIAFAEDYNVHVFLVAHPTKGVTVNGIDRVATLNDISGSGNFFNKTHNGISVFRDKKEANAPVQVHIQKVKFKFVGTLGVANLDYNRFTGNYTDSQEQIDL